MRKRDKNLSPDELARKELIKDYLKKLPSYDSLDLGALAREMMGSGATIIKKHKISMMFSI